MNVDAIFQVGRAKHEHRLIAGDMSIPEFVESFYTTSFNTLFKTKEDRTKFKKKLLKLAYNHYIGEYRKADEQLKKYRELKAKFREELKR